MIFKKFREKIIKNVKFKSGIKIIRDNMSAWQKIELSVFNFETSLIAVILDPTTGWTRAQSLASSEEIGDFIFETFCSFGFACCVVAIPDELDISEEKLKDAFHAKLKTLSKILRIEEQIANVDNVLEFGTKSSPETGRKLLTKTKSHHLNWEEMSTKIYCSF